MGMLSRWLRDPKLPAGTLPTRLSVVFGITGLSTLLVGTLLYYTPQLRSHLPVLVVGGTAFIATASLLLLVLCQATMHRWHTAGSAVGAGRTVSIRWMVLLVTLGVAALGSLLMGLHIQSWLERNRQRFDGRFIASVSDVVVEQLRGLSLGSRRQFVEDFPIQSTQTIILLLQEGRLTVVPRAAKAMRIGQKMRRKKESCLVGVTRFRCQLTDLDAQQQLAALVPMQGMMRSGPYHLLSLAFVILAALLGIALGRDTARDIVRVSAHLEGLVSKNGPDLESTLTVTSMDEVGEMIATVGTVRQLLAHDLQALQTALEDAQLAEEEKGKFLSAVNHQIRTPLTTLKGFAQLLLSGEDGELSAEQREDVEIIHKGSGQLLDLIKDVLDVSQMEGGQLQISREPVQLTTICQSIFAQFAAIPRLGRARATVTLVQEIAQIQTIMADPIRIQQVLQNLLSNAIKFTRRGTIWLRLHQDDQQTVIEVEDSGPGIPASELPHIFDEYRQAGTVRSKRAGSGLGLAITQRLVTLHGGTISVVSQVGRGSHFTVRLPRETT